MINYTFRVEKRSQKGYNFILKALENKECDMLIIDEIMAVLSYKFLSIEEALEIVNKMENTEIIMTGRNAPKELIKKADLVTEMKMIKHYFEKGIKARKGIEF